MVGKVLDVMILLAKEGMTMMIVTHEMGFAKRQPPRDLHGPRQDRRRLQEGRFFRRSGSEVTAGESVLVEDSSALRRDRAPRSGLSTRHQSVKADPAHLLNAWARCEPYLRPKTIGARNRHCRYDFTLVAFASCANAVSG
jgi:hypothetical protein